VSLWREIEVREAAQAGRVREMEARISEREEELVAVHRRAAEARGEWKRAREQEVRRHARARDCLDAATADLLHLKKVWRERMCAISVSSGQIDARVDEAVVEVRTMGCRMAELEAEVRSLTDTLIEREAAACQMREVVAAREAEAVCLRREVEDARGEAAEKRAALVSSSAEMHRMLEVLDAGGRTGEAAEREKVAAERKCAEMEKLIEVLRRRDADTAVKIEKFAEELRKSDARLTRKDERILALRLSVANFESSLALALTAFRQCAEVEPSEAHVVVPRATAACEAKQMPCKDDLEKGRARSYCGGTDLAIMAEDLLEIEWMQKLEVELRSELVKCAERVQAKTECQRVKEAEVEELRTREPKLRAALDEAWAAVREGEAAAEAKDDEIRSLSASVEELARTISERDEALASRASEVEWVRGDMEAKRDAMRALEARVREGTTRMAEMQVVLAERDREVAALRREMAVNEATQGQALLEKDAMLASRDQALTEARREAEEDGRRRSRLQARCDAALQTLDDLRTAAKEQIALMQMGSEGAGRRLDEAVWELRGMVARMDAQGAEVERLTRAAAEGQARASEAEEGLAARLNESGGAQVLEVQQQLEIASLDLEASFVGVKVVCGDLERGTRAVEAQKMALQERVAALSGALHSNLEVACQELELVREETEALLETIEVLRAEMREEKRAAELRLREHENSLNAHRRWSTTRGQEIQRRDGEIKDLQRQLIFASLGRDEAAGARSAAEAARDAAVAECTAVRAEAEAWKEELGACKAETQTLRAQLQLKGPPQKPEEEGQEIGRRAQECAKGGSSGGLIYGGGGWAGEAGVQEAGGGSDDVARWVGVGLESVVHEVRELVHEQGVALREAEESVLGAVEEMKVEVEEGKGKRRVLQERLREVQQQLEDMRKEMYQQQQQQQRSAVAEERRGREAAEQSFVRFQEMIKEREEAQKRERDGLRTAAAVALASLDALTAQRDDLQEVLEQYIQENHILQLRLQHRKVLPHSRVADPAFVASYENVAQAEEKKEEEEEEKEEEVVVSQEEDDEGILSPRLSTTTPSPPPQDRHRTRLPAGDECASCTHPPHRPPLSSRPPLSPPSNPTSISEHRGTERVRSEQVKSELRSSARAMWGFAKLEREREREREEGEEEEKKEDSLSCTPLPGTPHSESDEEVVVHSSSGPQEGVERGGVAAVGEGWGGLGKLWGGKMERVWGLSPNSPRHAPGRGKKISKVLSI